MTTTQELIEKFSPEQQRACVRLVDFAADRLPFSGWEERLRTGLAELATSAEAVWPRVVAGERVELGVSDLNGAFDGATDAEAMEFVAAAGYILLNGQDGPRATAAIVEEKLIDFLVKRVKGGNQ